MQKITPFLWFDNNAEEAAAFYVSIFKNSKVTEVMRQGGEKGKALTVRFELDGVGFVALNGGPHFKLNEAFSMYVDCETQAEVDSLWERLLSGGGQPSQCGWLKDKFGLSWQIIPKALPELMGDKDPAKAQRVVQAMMGMVKIDVEALRRAYEGA